MPSFWDEFWSGLKMGLNPLNWGTALKKDGMDTLSVCSSINDPIAGLICGPVCSVFSSKQDPTCLSAKVAGGLVFVSGLGWLKVPFFTNNNWRRVAAGCAWIYFWDPNVLDDLFPQQKIPQPDLREKYGKTRKQRDLVFEKGEETSHTYEAYYNYLVDIGWFEYLEAHHMDINTKPVAPSGIMTRKEVDRMWEENPIKGYKPALHGHYVEGYRPSPFH